jgi:hypothetical protein
MTASYKPLQRHIGSLLLSKTHLKNNYFIKCILGSAELWGTPSHPRCAGAIAARLSSENRMKVPQGYTMALYIKNSVKHDLPFE